MAEEFDLVRQAADATAIVRAPRQALATFGGTSIKYYVVTEPSYVELISEATEAVVRTGEVMAERPRLVTPFYLGNRFRGFPHGEEFARYLTEAFGPEAPGLLYSYGQAEGNLEIVHDPPPVVAGRLAEQLDRDGEAMAAVILGVDAFWDISLLKFVHDYTLRSTGHNLAELGERGLLGVERGVPREARARIEEMFAQVAAGELAPSELHAELTRWGAFAEYEDRFLRLFSRR